MILVGVGIYTNMRHNLTPDQRRRFVEDFFRPRVSQTWVNAPESGTTTPPIQWEGFTGPLSWSELSPHQRALIRRIEEDRRSERQAMTQEDVRSRESQDLYYRELDQRRNRGELSTEEYNKLRYPSASTRSKPKKKKKGGSTQESRKPGPKPPRPPPPPPTGRFSALTIR